MLGGASWTRTVGQRRTTGSSLPFARTGRWSGRHLSERSSANEIGRVIRQPIALDSP